MSLNKSKALRTAEKYVLQGRLPAAIDEYRKVVDADPADLTTINTLGDLYVRAGKIPDAIANFSRIADSYRESGFTLKAIAMLKKISKLDPTNVETSMKLANLYSQQGLLVEARQQYLQVADAYARAGQTRKALDAYQKIADLDPTNTSVRMKLGEIYSRESMMEQAHEAFIMAGAEFLRKNDIEQALTANLKALTTNPESRQGLTAIASIYTQQGQIDRAINILCEAFERNPGDVELLTILGRTYLSANLMDEAERTFLSLVELDRNRYHYLLEVGRRFLQMGDLDRAAEQIDGCLEILIAKREEDKAIDFLRRILDREMNHIGSLQRLAQIFLRIREDHNLIATLNSLTEAAMRKGNDADAIAALKELARLEPNEPLHLQRLYNLGVKDIVESDSPEVVRATGPLDFESAAFDDAFVIRQISEAEILAGHGQVSHSVEILTGILNHTPENVQVHLKLKDIYLRAGIMDKAANECLELARIHESRGESARASDFFVEARQLNPLIDANTPLSTPQANAAWPADLHEPFEIDGGNGKESPPWAAPAGRHDFDAPRSDDALDWSRYQTGAFGDGAGFVTAPEAPASADGAQASDSRGNGVNHAFRFTDTLVGDVGAEQRQSAASGDALFNSPGPLHSDTMTRVLHDELEGIDFYIAQGYIEIARDTLDRLRGEHGDHPEIVSRYKRLGITLDEAPSQLAEKPSAASQAPVTSPTSQDSAPRPAANHAPEARDYELPIAAQEPAQPSAEADPFTLTINRSPSDGERKNFLPFLIQKESGQLNPDLLVTFNTSELLADTAFQAAEKAFQGQAPAPPPLGTADLIESIVSDMESSFNEVAPHAGARVQPAPGELNGGHEAAPPSDAAQPLEPPRLPEAPPLHDNNVEPPSAAVRPKDNTTDELQQIFDELKDDTDKLTPPVDYETHYSLGLAYKDMDLLDEAIEQFQMAFKASTDGDLPANHRQCCHMLGVCFERKGMLKIAVMWFQRGLKITGGSEDEQQALRYEIAQCYQDLGELDKALDAFMEVYGTDVNYRGVTEKIRQLQAAKNA